MIRTKFINASFRLCNRSVKMMIEFEKQVSRLKAITNKNIGNNIKVKKLIIWFRNEYVKRPEKYIGDYVVLAELRNHIAKGLTLTNAANETYNVFKDGFAVVDRNRDFIK